MMLFLQISTASPLKLDILPGGFMVIEFSSGSDDSNNGIGFRLHWQCEDYRTPLF